MASPQPGPEGVRDLVRRLVGQARDLAGLHLRSAREEIGDALDAVKAAAILFLVALLVLWLGLVVGVVFVILGLADLLGLPAWLIALAALGVVMVAAILLAWAGVRRLRRARFVPEETIASVREDLEWAKRRIGRG